MAVFHYWKGTLGRQVSLEAEKPLRRLCVHGGLVYDVFVAVVFVLLDVVVKLKYSEGRTRSCHLLDMEVEGRKAPA